MKGFIKQRFSSILVLVFIALFICTFFEQTVRTSVHSMADTKQVLVTMGTEYGYDDDLSLPVVIVDNNYASDADGTLPSYVLSFDQLFNSIVESKGFEKKYNAVDGTYFLEATLTDSYIIFELPYLPETMITFPTGSQCDVFVVTAEGGEAIVPWNPASTEHQVVTVFPFRSQTDAYQFPAYIGLYVGIFALVFGTLISIFWLIVRKDSVTLPYGNTVRGVMGSLNPKALFAIFFISLSVFYVVSYKMNPTPYYYGNNMMSDAYYYANGPFFDQSGAFSLNYYMNTAMLHRGIYHLIMFLIFKVVAGAISKDIMYFFLVAMSFFLAVAFSYFVPKLYKAIFQERTNNTCVTLLFLSYIFFWNQTIRIPLSDTLGCILLLGSIAFLFTGLREQKISAYAISGVFVALAVNWRTSYSLVYYIQLVVLILMTVSLMRNSFSKEHIVLLNKKEKIKVFSKNLSYVVVFAAFFLLACTPQYVIYLIGGGDPFKSTNIMWYSDYVNGFNFSIVETNLSQSLRFYSNFSSMDLDRQFNDSFSDIYQNNVLYSYKDFLYIVLNHPLQYIMLTSKRLFWAMSISPKWVSQPWITTGLLINWGAQAALLYSLIHKKIREILHNRYSIGLIAASFLFVAFPQVILAIEQRYFMWPHLVLLFFAVLPISGSIIQKESIRKEYMTTKFFLFLLCFVLCSAVAYYTILSNFLY